MSINSVERNTGQLCKLKQLDGECLHRVRGRVARAEVGQGGQEFGRVRDSGSEGRHWPGYASPGLWRDTKREGQHGASSFNFIYF